VVTVRRIPCEVTAVHDHGEQVYTVDLRPETPAPQFAPGQFLHLALDPYEPGGFWPESRVFSIASSPLDRTSLAITYAVKGAFTGRMERELVEGAAVWTKLPYGDFVVDPTGDAVLFAGGTGVTAFTTFLQSLGPEHTARVLLCYGARTKGLLVFADLAQECARNAPCLDVHLFAEDREGKLSVDAVWDAVEHLHEPVFYLSGPPQMLTALSAQLGDRGVSPGDIRTDAWE
jgi:ferredoxin-NADP reductase